MPELPEVETVVRGLRGPLVGKKITDITFYRADIRFVLPKKLPALAKGQKIIAVDRVAKYILITLARGEKILIHLGMSGRLIFRARKNFMPDKHDHVVIHLDHGVALVFNDARRFGVFDYMTAGQTHRLLQATGCDPFDATLTPKWLHDKSAKLSCDMKAFLMNQKIIAGLGNIYVSEALFRAKIWPERAAKTLTMEECKKLVPAIRAVLHAAIKAGGSSLRDYVQSNGELGFFQDKFKVYGRADAPCVACGTPIVKLTQAGRSTFACSNCQE